MTTEKLSLKTIIENTNNIQTLISTKILTVEEVKQLIRGKSFEEIDKTNK